MKTAGIACTLLVLSLAAPTAVAQRLGPEFHVNADTTNYQRLPAVAADSTGNFVVVWRSSVQNASFSTIFGRRFSSTGTAVGEEFRVNPVAYHSEAPAVASDSSGNFVVVWQTVGPDGDAFGVAGQRYASSGAPLGASFQVNTSTPGNQYKAQVASISTGGFVVAWEDTGGADGYALGIFGRRYDVGGAPLGGEFRINTYTSGQQENPDVASDAAGGFVVVWSDHGLDGDVDGVFAQRYASSGAPLGSAFRVNTFTTGLQGHPRVAFAPAGNFVVVWQSTQDGNGYGVYGQRYASSGQPIGGEFRVNTFTTGQQRAPVVSSDGSGNLFVVWNGTGPEGNGYEVHGRFLTAAGGRYGAEFLVNTTTSGTKRSPRVAALSVDHFVVVWDGYVGFTDTEVYGQRFQRCRSSDVNGDGKLDVNDVFYLINALFAGGPPPPCGGDCNDDGKTDVADIFYLINFLFAGGPPPA
jgi:hypothetical protein